jgi:hypothetical protein
MSGFTFHWRDSRHPDRLANHPHRVRHRDELRSNSGAKPPRPTSFVGDAAPAPLLFQFAHFDIGVTAAESEAFYAAASEPKEQHWYDTGHVVNDVTAVADRARFLARHLDLPALPGIVAQRIG